ncbi:hypothetical protein Cob_v011845 [Colletotrichum orbiculare MAFF 240422]|uniref:Uncharacterized protein n=1 Tax=Colletotrichum orbiculare (strain 104-T / ATCC 96160 / CBS 514.97 / LARS 414 / MAFF 240422) TaxID=1213857 RepID=A0A484FCY7_COLOR|nr:hypothetical protein Cob_v011845 [Colletotrichum orbiculare MAFF 240422]
MGGRQDVLIATDRIQPWCSQQKKQVVVEIGAKTLSTAAFQCQNSFADAVTSPRLACEAAYVEALQNLLQSFNLWTGYIGVFAEGRASLDHRLRRHLPYHDMVLALLRLLHTQLHFINVSEDDSSDSDSEDSLEDGLNGIASGLDMTAKTIDELNRLAIRIRQSNTSSLDARRSSGDST